MAESGKSGQRANAGVGKSTAAKKASSADRPKARRILKYEKGPLPVGGLFTGLVDYGFWVDMFEGHEPVPGEFRRGRIWT